jgi:hypothetical protein
MTVLSGERDGHQRDKVGGKVVVQHVTCAYDPGLDWEVVGNDVCGAECALSVRGLIMCEDIDEMNGRVHVQARGFGVWCLMSAIRPG